MNKYATTLARAMEAKSMRIAALAREVGSSASYISQCKAGKLPLSDAYAEEVAALLGVQPQDISEQYARKLKAGAALENMGVRSLTAALPPGHVRLEPLAGFGPLMEGMPYAVMPEALVRKKIAFTPIEQVRYGFNPSKAMAPEIEYGALFLVDASQTAPDEVIDGMVYAYRLHGRPNVRRLLVRKRRLYVGGHHASAAPAPLSDDDLEQLSIGGLVIGAY